jgi:hypothetical protein
VTVSATFSSTPKNSNEYRLVSFPGYLNVVTVSQLNLTGTQDEDWKMFREPGKSSQSFIALGKSNTLKTGEGYWFLQKGALSKTVSFATPSLSIDATATITLSGGTYSIIGNPFNVKVPWASVLSVNNLPSNTPLYSWNGGWSSANTALQPGVGYYINSTSITTLKIPYAGFGFPSKVAPSDFPEPDWRLQLIFATENSRDDDNYIGIVPGSSLGKDQFEFNKPPLVFGMSFLYMKRPAWDATEDMFFADYRPEISTGQTWNFEVTNPDKTVGTLTVADVGQIPAQYDAYLVNEETGFSVDLRRQQSMHYGAGTAQGHFKIIIGPPGYVAEQTKQFTPTEFGLKQNYPNPFNPATTITFTLPSVSPVRLEVFSLLGQKVKTLVSGEYGQGVHQVVWAGDDDSGRKVASGVYLYRLNVGAHGSFVNKMVLTK